VPNDLTDALRKLIRLGKERGYVTHDEVEATPHAQESPEFVEDLMAMLNDCDIHVVAAAPEGGAPPAGT
jgi:hypothetical protein